MRGIDALESRGHRMGVVSGGVDLKIEQPPRIMRLEPRRRFAHHVEVEIVHPRLVQHDMRKLRQPVFGVLHPSAAQDILGRCAGSGFQNVVSLIQQASFSTRSLKPKASNISMVRQAMPSAWPRSKGPGFCSTMQVLMSGKADNCAASVNPAGPQPTMRMSTSAGTVPDIPEGGCAKRRVRNLGVAGFKSVEMELHENLPVPDAPFGPELAAPVPKNPLPNLLSMLIISIRVKRWRVW